MCLWLLLLTCTYKSTEKLIQYILLSSLAVKCKCQTKLIYTNIKPSFSFIVVIIIIIIIVLAIINIITTSSFSLFASSWPSSSAWSLSLASSSSSSSPLFVSLCLPWEMDQVHLVLQRWQIRITPNERTDRRTLPVNRRDLFSRYGKKSKRQVNKNGTVKSSPVD